MSRSRGEWSVTSSSPTMTRPLDTCSSPAMHRSSVVFPHPDGPTSTMNSPSAISRLTSSTALTPRSVIGDRPVERLRGLSVGGDDGHRAGQDRVLGRLSEEHLDLARLDHVHEVSIVEAELADRHEERDPPRLSRFERQAQEALELALGPRDGRLRIARVELHDLVADSVARVRDARLDDEL